MFFEIFFEHFSDLQSSETRHEYETEVKRWYEREETERNAPIIPEQLLGGMSPLGDIKIRKGKHYAFSMKASKKLYLTVRAEDEAIV